MDESNSTDYSGAIEIEAGYELGEDYPIGTVLIYAGYFMVVQPYDCALRCTKCMARTSNKILPDGSCFRFRCFHSDRKDGVGVYLVPLEEL